MLRDLPRVFHFQRAIHHLSASCPSSLKQDTYRFRSNLDTTIHDTWRLEIGIHTPAATFPLEPHGRVFTPQVLTSGDANG